MTAGVRVEKEAIETIEITVTSALAGILVVSRTALVLRIPRIRVIQKKVIHPKIARRVSGIEGKVTATRAVALKVEREVAAKKSTSRMVRTISVVTEVNIVPKGRREVIEVKAIVEPITESIEMNVAKEMFSGICANAALGTNIPTELVTDRMIVGRDPSGGIETIDGPNRITEISIPAKDMSEEFSTETEMRIVVIIALTLVAARFPTDRILDLSTVEIEKADSAMRTFAGTVVTEEAK